MNTEPAVLPPPTGGPAATLPPPGAAATTPAIPFLPTAPSLVARPATERPTAVPLQPANPFVQALGPTSSPARKRKSGGIKKALTLFVVACVVSGLVFGATKVLKDEPRAELVTTDERSDSQPADAGVAATGDSVVVSEGRVTFVAGGQPLRNDRPFSEPDPPGQHSVVYTLQGDDIVMLMVLTFDQTVMDSPGAVADALAVKAAGGFGGTVTRSEELPVKAGRGFSYVLEAEGQRGYLRLLMADTVIVTILSQTGDNTDAVAGVEAWNSLTFDGVAIN